MAASGNAIGIMGGTFDPVHVGHTAIAESFLSSGYINSLLILLTPTPPHKPDQKLTDYSLRLRMLMTAFREYKNVKVSDLELTLNEPSYTYRTVRYLKKMNPDQSYYLCIGGDSFGEFKEWYKWRGILKMCDLLVAERPDTKTDKNNKLQAYSHFIEHKPKDISSSQIREKIRNGENVDGLVPDNVLQIIDEKGLYKDS